MDPKDAMQNIEDAIEKLLFGMGEKFPKVYVDMMNESVRIVKGIVNKEVARNDKSE